MLHQPSREHQIKNYYYSNAYFSIANANSNIGGTSIRDRTLIDKQKYKVLLHERCMPVC